MHSKTKLSYTSTDRKRFAEFFVKKEKKRRVGRPKRKKRKYNNKKRKKTDNKKDGVVSARRKLFDDRCAGEAAKDKHNKPKRVNWDIEPNYSYRDQCATSWITQTDQWIVGENFGRFATRCGIDRNVLQRYINKVKKNTGPTKPKGEKRGRKGMLSQSVIHHLCEGRLSVCVLLPLECSSRHCNAFCSRTET